MGCFEEMTIAFLDTSSPLRVFKVGNACRHGGETWNATDVEKGKCCKSVKHWIGAASREHIGPATISVGNGYWDGISRFSRWCDTLLRQVQRTPFRVMTIIEQFLVSTKLAFTLTVRIRSSSGFSSRAGRLHLLMSKCTRCGNPFLVKHPREWSAPCASNLFPARFSSIRDVSTWRELGVGCWCCPPAIATSAVAETSSLVNLRGGVFLLIGRNLFSCDLSGGERQGKPHLRVRQW